MQFDLFPEWPAVDVLDVRAIVGPRTTVDRLLRVRIVPGGAPHLIYHDRHGWYCELHGPHCAAVALAQDRLR